MSKLDLMQFRFNQKLYDMALKLDDVQEEQLDDVQEEQRAKRRERRSETAISLLGRVWDFWREQEIEALRDILDVEQYQQM